MAPSPPSVPGPRDFVRGAWDPPFIASDDDALWSFALAAYERPGVRHTCLRLQDEHGLDVDLALAILWMASRGTALDATTLRGLCTDVAPIRGWVTRMRRLRREAAGHAATDPTWTGPAEAAAAAELAGERLELQWLYGRLATIPSSGDEPEAAAAAGLHAYAGILGADVPSADLAILVAGLHTDDP